MGYASDKEKLEYFFKKKELAARYLIFIILIFAFGNFVLNRESLLETIATIRQDLFIQDETLTDSDITFAHINAAMDSISRQIEENFIGKYVFLEEFGYLQLLMNKDEQSGFETVKDQKGLLHYTYFAESPRNTISLTQNIFRFKNAIRNEDVQFLYVLTPNKYIPGQTQFASGIPYHFENETADIFLERLKSLLIDTVDLREHIIEQGISYEDMFFKTSSHWNIEFCFWAFTELINVFSEKYDIDVDPDGFYRNLEHYNVVRYPSSYIGDLGRYTGKYYAGVDDFSVIFPKFKTNFHLSMDYSSEYDYALYGLFEDVFISSYILRNKNSPYLPEMDKYFAYLPNNQSIYHIRNNKNPDGLKVVFIKDSMMNPVISLMSNVASDIYAIDPLLYNQNIANFINSIDVDIVIVSFAPQNITEAFLSFTGN